MGERAGVIRFNGRWTASAGEKFRVRDGQPDTVLASGTGAIPAGAAPPAPPPRGRAARAERPAGRPPAAPVQPTVPPPTGLPPRADRGPAPPLAWSAGTDAAPYIRDRIAQADDRVPTPTTQVAAADPRARHPRPS